MAENSPSDAAIIDPVASAASRTASTSSKPLKTQSACRFYNSKSGCKAGDACKFSHQSATPKPTDASKTAPKATRVAAAQEPRGSALPMRERNAATGTSPAPRPQSLDQRVFQINQIVRRFKPTVTEGNETAAFTFKMKPTDPDFPYDIDELECVLSIPLTWPGSKQASLRVTNTDIPRGFQINIERGFSTLIAENPSATLLNLMKLLDKQLETILSGKKADTIVFVPNKAPPSTVAKQQPVATAKPPALAPKKPELPPPVVHTDEQKVNAQAKRQMHTRQLDARFGRLPTFKKSPDGHTYTLPLDSPKKSTWPASLRNLREVLLVVPALYPLDHCTIILNSDAPEAKAVEDSFERRQIAGHDATLTQCFNYLVQNMKDLAVVSKIQTPSITQPEPISTPVPPVASVSTQPVEHTKQEPSLHIDEDRPHIQFIPRPPEWDHHPHSDNQSESDSYDSESKSESEEVDSDADEEEQPINITATPAERGILISFPHIELYSVELLQVESLSVTVKCERCKELTDITKLRNYDGSESAMRKQTCKKCACILSAGFRADMIHVNSARAGYLDLDGCAVVDMLPSNFIPTCSECSTAYPSPGIVSVRGDSTLTICRECHRKMTFRISEVKFLAVSAAAIRASNATGRRKIKENLGITAGTPLPKTGRCSHYNKSNRWFRFSCCSKVFPCDRCHDAEMDHPIEHANRMLCGFCSREQNFRPEDCGICHATLVGKKGKGFWEGGKGTRDPRKMSRKDPRKYKRAPGSKPKTT